MTLLIAGSTQAQVSNRVTIPIDTTTVSVDEISAAIDAVGLLPGTTAKIRLQYSTDGTPEYVFPREVALDYANLLEALDDIAALIESYKERERLNNELVGSYVMEITNMQGQLDILVRQVEDLQEQNASLGRENDSLYELNDAFRTELRKKFLILGGTVVAAIIGGVVYLLVTASN